MTFELGHVPWNKGISCAEKTREKIGKANRKYTLNENYFEKIDNQEKAYFLGFMYADGNVTEAQAHCNLTLQKKDKKILERFKTLLNYTGPLHQINRNKAWRLIICSSKIKKDLINKGCMPNKTFKIEFPLWLREDLKVHFIRGFNDGDGSIFISKRKLKVSIGGRKDFLKAILNLSKINGHLKKYDYCKIFHLRFHSSFAVSFCNWIYKDATIYLERKYKKYIDFMNSRKLILNVN